MRECPCCHYKDPPYWRNVRFRIFTSCCHINDLELHEPELAKRILSEKDLRIGNYIYHYVEKAKIVQRIHVDDSRDGVSWREPDQEKHFKFRVPEQTELLACNSAEESNVT